MKKKVIALFLVLAMIVASFAACGKSENGGKANEGGKTDTAQGGDTSDEEFSWPVKDGKLSMWLWWTISMFPWKDTSRISRFRISFQLKPDMSSR
ncbi:MAG: hypothetical protein IKS09_00480, partial [Lachnospiraceae bacterium]|nr:hypothetical protein [Lachnospiraceae bacterium]